MLEKETPSILVTGSHRSGTTWVGRMLTLSRRLVYVGEPFNVRSGHELFTHKFDRWFEYVCPSNEDEVLGALQDIVELRYPTAYRVRNIDSFREGYSVLRSAVRYSLERWMGRSVLIKDPIALLSAERLAEHFDLEVLVMIRHPAAFAGSLKKKGWTFPFEDLLNQPRLMRDHFSSYAQEIRSFAKDEQDIADQAALLWTLLYTVVSRYREQHPSWTFLRHEDVARAPVETFRELYEQFGLSFTERIRENVEEYSNPSSGDSTEEEGIRRNSQSVVRNWTERLTEDEIKRVRKRTYSVASNFYTPNEW